MIGPPSSAPKSPRFQSLLTPETVPSARMISFLLTLERARSPVAPHGAVELVGARLGDRVHDAAGGAAELGEVAAGDHVDLLEELDREAGADEAEARVVHRHAVDDVLVLRRGRAGDRDAVLVARRARSELGERLERPRRRALTARANDRDVLDEVRADRDAGRGRTDVDRRRLADDLFGAALQGLGEELNVDANRLVETEGDAAARVGLVLLLLETEGVDATRAAAGCGTGRTRRSRPPARPAGWERSQSQRHRPQAAGSRRP